MYLENYLMEVRFSIDNNLADRDMKLFVMVRKNFLFCITKNGVIKLSTLYSIGESTKVNNLNDEKYLNFCFDPLVEIDNPTDDDYNILLPYSKTIMILVKNFSD